MTEQEEKEFYSTPISDSLFLKMQGKSFKADCTLPREDLRYVHVLHTGFDGETHEGELVCNRRIASTLLTIFRRLYLEKYPIEKIRLVDEYDAEDERSMADNNSSCFNFRCISYTDIVSKHGLGIAIDINPLYNPYVKQVGNRLSIEPANGEPYVDRSRDFPYKIDHQDLAYRLFTEQGFTWGGDWTESKDYQHFELLQAVPRL
ncbi:MAG: M15 family metallopeptidase [Lachnospiraceae bacterium]|nr:M15 family metallopeptidase [Lachnospiraceae bacterium]